MISNPTRLFQLSKFLFIFMLVVLPPTKTLFAQEITFQKLPFSAICAGGAHPTIPNSIFNEYQASFTVSGFNPTVTFKVELSDTSGSFSTTQTETINLPPLSGTPPDTSENKTLTFAIPSTIVGSDTYRLRVKSSTGITSQPFTIFGSVSEKYFSAYFKPYNGSFFINDKLPTINFCSGGSVTLTIYNPTPDDVNSSPANFTNLRYNWYKNDVLINGETSDFLVIDSEGKYYAKLNYGPCSDDNFRSQEVTAISSGIGGGAAAITSSLGNPFCSIEKTVLTASSGNSYIWRFNGAIIKDVNTQSYTTDELGIYTCEIDLGGCTATGTIDLKNYGTISTNGDAIAEGETLKIVDGTSISVTATTDDPNPTYQWYLNNVAIKGATENILDISAIGKYKVVMSGCELSFKVSNNGPSVVIPNIVTSTNNWIIPELYDNTNTKVTILSSFGEIVYTTDNYSNDSSWPQSSIVFKNFNPVFYYIITPLSGSAKKGSITLMK